MICFVGAMGREWQCSLGPPVEQNAQVVRLGRVTGAGGSHAFVREGGEPDDCAIEGALASQLDNLIEAEVVGESVAGEEDRVAACERNGGSEFDPHLGGTNGVEDEMALVVVEGLLLIEQPGFHRKTHRGVRDGLQLEFATLADDKNDGVADMVGPGGVPADLHGHERAAGIRDLGEEVLIGGFDAVQDRGAEELLGRFDGKGIAKVAHHGGRRCTAAAGSTHSVGHREDDVMRPGGNDGPNVLVRLAERMGTGDYDRRPVGKGNAHRLLKIGLDENRGTGRGGLGG
jgi:hypothetical protein